jgi:hypothetical protein
MSRKQPAILGLLVVALLASWQFLTVHYNYQGNWTALFRIRPTMPVPAFLRSEHLYTFPGTEGYDGQVYHLIAHDPWMTKGSRDAIVGWAFRYQRILVPALAWMLALGQDRFIDAAYAAVILALVFLGVYWLSLIALRLGLSPIWGVVFALAPAQIVSIDRMTVDVALAAFTAGFALYASQGRIGPAAIVLTCAALTRETALPIIAGYALFLVTQKQIRNALLIAAAALPAAAWFVYLSRLSRMDDPSPVVSYANWIPLAGFADRVTHPALYSGISASRAYIAIACDYLALAAIAITLVAIVRLSLRREWTAQSAALYCLALAAIFIGSRGVWEEAEAFGRVLTPLLFLAGIDSLGRHARLAFVPMILVDLPISLTLWQQIAGVVRGIL